MSFSVNIPLVLDAAPLEYNVKVYIEWDTKAAPHLLMMGATGSGKTYGVKVILGHIARYAPTARLVVCDFKGDDDFAFLQGKENYFRFDTCSKGLQKLCDILKARQQGQDTSREFTALMFDEWASYLNSISDKKQCEAEKQKLANLLMLGRSFNIHVIVSQQRADAQYFNTARENFNIVCALGNLSQEARQMFFSDFKDKIELRNSRGNGYMLVNGMNFTRVVVPTVRNMDRLHGLIRQIVE